MFVLSSLSTVTIFVLGSKTLEAPPPDAVISADKELIQAIGKADKAGVERLLDSEFTWIDSNGRSRTRAEVLQTFPTPANSDVEVQVRSYEGAAVVRANRGRMQVLRIWAKRAGSWKAMLYQEVMLAVKSEPTPQRWGEPVKCENPCKTIPFQPETESEKQAIAYWQGVMKAMADNDPEEYAPLIADEFTATDTHHDMPYTKENRLAQLRKQKQSGGGSIPSALISARMFDFGETVMMIAREQRPGAKPYFNTRMWVRRDGRWQMLFSFNTRIE